MSRFDGKMKSEDPSAVEADFNFLDSSPEPLHSIFCHMILKWFEYGIQMNVPTIKKHVITCPTRCSLPVFLNELQKSLHRCFPDYTTKFFKKNLDGVYTRIDVTKESQLMKSRRNEKSEKLDIIVTNRNEKEWRTILYEKDILELNNQIHKGNKNKKFDSHIITHHSSFEQVGSENGTINSGYVSSPTAPHGPNPHSDSIPISQSHPLFKYREVSTSNSIFIHRQHFFLAILRDDELTVYTYNWMKELYEMLHNLLNQLCQWTFARKCLLSSLVLQKLGLFHNEPFVRKDYEVKDESSRKEIDKKEGINPYVQNVHYIESLIKSTYPGRDSLGPKERSGRRGQNQTSLQNLSEVLRDSAPPKPLISCSKSGHRNLLQKHGMQMAEVTRFTIQREKERSTLQSMIQSQTAATPIFTDLTLSLFKKHARITHFCLTPLLFLPKWRAEVAAVTDHSFPDCNSQGYQENFSHGKISESRSRHESGASAKVPHLELRRSSSVGLPPTGLSSPNQNRRRHPTLGGEDKWHDALCLRYLKEFIHYLQCLGFTSLCIQETPKQSSRGQGNFNVKEESHEVKIPDQDISSPTYLVRHVFGGTVLLQINFVEPYFSVMGYTLEASRTQPKKLKNKSQNNTFIDEVEVIRILLHMHSFTYDYHLRAVCVYVADRQLLFARGYHLSSFLSDFIKYYQKGPNFARNLIQSGEVRIEDTGTPGEQLYNYLLAREKEYQMKVLRMTPVLLDFTSDRQTEFVLVHTKAYRFPFNEENEQRDGDDYDVTLLVSHDTNVSDYDSNLNLKFYVILTSRREMYPNRNSEGKNGRFRTVSTADTIEQIRKVVGNDVALEHEPSVEEEIPTDFLIAAGGSNASSNSSFSDNDKGQSTSASSRQGTTAAKIQKKSPLIPMRQESVNYLGYFSDYEMHMQQILEQQVAEARERILHIFNTAKIHCRRDSLWQKLMWGLKEEERLKSSKEQASHILTFNEFSELLNLVSVKSISALDPQLLPLVSKPLHWYHSLARLLSAKYQDNNSYGSRILTSSDGNIQYVVVYSLGCPDACMMISQNVFTQRADICCVRKHIESDKLEPRVQAFFQDIINCCCFHLWSGLI